MFAGKRIKGSWKHLPPPPNLPQEGITSNQTSLSMTLASGHTKLAMQVKSLMNKRSLWAGMICTIHWHSSGSTKNSVIAVLLKVWWGVQMISKLLFFWNFIVHCLVLSTYCHPFMLRKHRSGSRGGMQEVYTPTPWDDVRFSKISSILWKTTTTTTNKQNKTKKWDQVEVISAAPPSGGHLMEPQSLLISWVNPFPSRFINRTIFFCNVFESHECVCWLLFDVISLFSLLFPLSKRETSLWSRSICKSTRGRVDFKGLYAR